MIKPHPLFFKNIHITHPTNIFSGLVLIFVLQGEIEHFILYGWLAVLFLVTFTRIWLSRVHPYSRKSKENQQSQRLLLFIGITTTGLVWALTPWLLFPENDVIKQMFVVFVLMGLTAGSPSASGSNIVAFLCFSQPILISLSLRFSYEEEFVFHVMALLTQIYNVALIITSINFSRIDSRLRAAIKALEKANLGKSEFLANMSHEFLTPMNAIVGINHLLKQTPLTREQADFVDKSGIASNSLLGVIENVLDYSKIESQQDHIHIAPFKLQTVLDTATTLVELEAHKKGLLLSSDITSNTTKSLKGDAVKLAQILSNLMKNAVKFTDVGEVELLIEEIGTTDEKVLIHFSVSDTGMGIHYKDHEKIFQSFSQIKTRHKRLYGGTGLGLSISQKLANLMGSEIALESELEEGSTFSFSVWLDKDSSNAQTDLVIEQPITTTLDGYCVLLVDDDELNQMIACDLLQQLGLQVEVADSAKQAFSFLERRLPDLILLDIRMPEIDGYEAIAIIRSNKQWGKIPVICLTAHTRAIEKEKSLSAGMDDFLTKPINPTELEKILLKHLTEHTRNTPDNPQNTSTAATHDSSKEVNQNILNLIDMLENKEVALIFLKKTIASLTESINELQQNLTQHNWKQASQNAHRLRGTANLYASTLLQRYLKDIDTGLVHAENSEDVIQQLLSESDLVIHLMMEKLEE